jgi:hypothetical protein
MRKKFILIVTALVLCNLLARGQDYILSPGSISCAGTYFHNASMPDIHFIWTLGETVTGDFHNPSGDKFLTHIFVGYLIPVDIQEVIIGDEISVSPNPATDKLKIVFKKPFANEKSILIYNLQGQIINDIKTNQSETEINIKDLNPGLYFIRVNNNGQNPVSVKFIKY